MTARTVPLTVEAEHILPLIKRFMYPDRAIFLRELVSNATDALEKLTAIALTEQGVVDDAEPLRVEISLDPVRATLTVSDNGIGMTNSEILSYINQLAFSGAKDFLDRYAQTEARLIGQFGLGFYSSFMVSKRVEIDTLSWQPGVRACHWSCEGGTTASLSQGQRQERGTTVVCHLEDDAREFLDPQRVAEVVRRFLDYARHPIFLQGRQLNVIIAPWHLNRTERETLPRERYWSFYERLNPGENHPLTWLHVDTEHPLQVHALLFVPDQQSHQGSGNVRFFTNRSFVCDRCEEILPRWLGFVDGVVDSPDLPINVARDRFQAHRNVRLLRRHLTSKFVDHLGMLLQRRRADYGRVFESYGAMIKQGYLESVIEEHEALAAKLQRLLAFPSSRRPLATLEEYLERADETGQPTVLYTSDPRAQEAHLELHRNRGREVLFFTDAVDVLVLDALRKTRPEWALRRVDQDEAISASTKTERSAPPASEVDWSIITSALLDLTGPRVARVTVEALPSREIPAVLNVTRDTAMRQDIGRIIRRPLASGEKWHLVINSNSSLMRELAQLGERLRSSELPSALLAQTWDNVQWAADAFEEAQLADALRRSREFLGLVARLLGKTEEGSTR